MTVTISLHGWDWVWLLFAIVLAAFLWGFFGTIGRELFHDFRKRRP
jgi:hypothetical protein